MPTKPKNKWKYKLVDERGVTVAKVESSIKKDALREINHYAFMYGQDGPVKIVEVR